MQSKGEEDFGINEGSIKRVGKSFIPTTGYNHFIVRLQDLVEEAKLSA